MAARRPNSMQEILQGAPPSPFRSKADAYREQFGKNSPIGSLGQQQQPLSYDSPKDGVPPFMPPRTAWNSPSVQPLPMKLPPLEAQQEKLRYELMSAPAGPNFDARQNAPPSMEPFNIALTHQGRQTDVIQERLMQLESRVMTAERQASEATRFIELQGQRMSSLASEVRDGPYHDNQDPFLLLYPTPNPKPETLSLSVW